MEKKQEIVFGLHPVLELLKAKKRKIYSIYTIQPVPKTWHSISNLIPKYTKIFYVQKEFLNKLANSTDHQSIVAIVSPFIIRKKFFNPEKEKFLILLDGVQDPRNLGAILRSAYCTGVQGVIITQKASSPLSPIALKSSAGLAEHLDIYFSPTAKNALNQLKEAGYNIFLSVLTDKKNALNIDFKFPLCIVIGNEATGISQNILNSGQQVTLPQQSVDISYNVSVASGILLFIIATQNKII